MGINVPNYRVMRHHCHYNDSAFRWAAMCLTTVTRHHHHYNDSAFGWAVMCLTTESLDSIPLKLICIQMGSNVPIYRVTGHHHYYNDSAFRWAVICLTTELLDSIHKPQMWWHDIINYCVWSIVTYLIIQIQQVSFLKYLNIKAWGPSF